MAYTCPLFSTTLSTSVYYIYKLVDVDFWDWKPCCSSINIPSNNLDSLGTSNCSNNFDTALNLDIGW